MGWLQQLFSRHRRYDELSESIREHLDEKIADLTDRGMTQEEAERTARREFGNVTLIEERSREVWQWPTLESIWADIKFATKQLLKSPGFTLSALLTLGLGIGANAAVFSIIYAVMFRPLPYAHPERLVSIQSRITTGGTGSDLVSYPNFFDWRSRNSAFAGITAYHDDDFSLQNSGGAEHLDGEVVSWDLFSVLGIKPIIGRGFLPDEESGGTHVVVLSYDLWARQYNADPNLIGHSITIDKQTYTVVGVAPKSFRFPVQNSRVALWTTIAHDALPVDDNPPLTTVRGARTLDIIARLKPGTTIQAAQTQMDGLAAALAQQYPADNIRLAGVYIQTELDELTGGTKRPLYILLGAVTLVLLIACANIAGLLLLRTTERWRELAMRTALGAGRFRVIRQLLTENLVLAILGSAAGLFFCFLSSRFLIKFAVDSIPRIAQSAVDLQVFAFLAVLSIITAVLFSLPAAMQIAKFDFIASLKTSTAQGTLKQDNLRNSMVVAQIAIGLVLLSGATLLISSLMNLEKQDIGVRTDHLLTFTVGSAESQSGVGKQATFYPELLDKLDHTPGIISAGATYPLPLTGDQLDMAFDIQGLPTSRSSRPRSDMAFITPGYFATAGISIIQGRDFMRSDDAKSQAVFIVNKAFADKFFPDENPIGKRIRGGSTLREIVGVVGNARQSALNPAPEPIGYLPFYQMPGAPVSVVVHTSLPPPSIEPTIRAVLSSLDQQAPVYEVRTIQDLLSAQIVEPRLYGILISIFAGLALTLTVVGLYGAMAYSVSRRKRDIGIRIALGATRRNVASMILWQASLLMLLGIFLGLVGAFSSTALLRNMLYGIAPADPMAFLIACAVMSIAGGIAAYLPARRAAAIDPMKALRSE
jgi:predicted permease